MLAPMNTELLRTFTTVVAEGGFSRAARALRVGQSTVSLHIKALEELCGARLLDRAGRGVALTASGRLLLGRARRLLGLEDELLAAVRSEEAGEAGRVVIAASSIPADYLLPPLLAAFHQRHPDVNLVVDVSDSERATAALLAGACDLAVVGAAARDKRIAATRLAEDEVVLVGPTRGHHAAVRAVSRRELGALPILLREPGSGTHEAIARLLPRPSSPAPAGTVQVGTTLALRRLVQAGLGFAFLSRLAIADDVAAGHLQVVRLPGTPVRRAFHVATLRTVTPSAAARSFLRFVRGEAAPAGGRRVAASARRKATAGRPAGRGRP